MVWFGLVWFLVTSFFEFLLLVSGGDHMVLLPSAVSDQLLASPPVADEQGICRASLLILQVLF